MFTCVKGLVILYLYQLCKPYCNSMTVGQFTSDIWLWWAI